LANWQNYKGNAVLATYTWYYLGVTFKDAGADTALFFRNGVKIDSSYGNSVLTTNSDSLFIGRNKSGGAEFFDGRIDEVRVYRRALTPAEVAALAK
jgi:hypothetical protein